MYLAYDCCATTPVRTWAWSGTHRQAYNMVRQFPAAEDFELYWDGEEKYGEPIDVS